MNANTKWHVLVRGSNSRHMAGGGQVHAFCPPATGTVNFFEPNDSAIALSSSDDWAKALVTHMTSWAAARGKSAVVYHATSWKPVSAIIESILESDPSWVKHHEEGSALDDGFIDRIYWRKEVSA
jgi:hypothetical protein